MHNIARLIQTEETPFGHLSPRFFNIPYAPWPGLMPSG
jgi:hypothetical protein